MSGRGVVQESHSKELLRPRQFLLVNKIIRNENIEKNVDVDTSIVFKKSVRSIIKIKGTDGAKFVTEWAACIKQYPRQETSIHPCSFFLI